MKWLRTFNQKFGFTPTESRVVFFLIGTFFIGICARVFLSRQPPLRHFDYANSDSIFLSRSAQKLSPETLRVRPATPVESSFGQPAKPKPRIIDINTAAKEDFITLPGIGEAMAERIIIYREENGPFHSVDDLLNVKGIGRKKLDKIAPYCIIRN